MIVFDTPGLIDPRAFAVMGMSAKPNSANPIGYFGTGLKYAMAVLVRLGAKPIIWIGRDRYEFFLKPAEFRGSQFEMLRMKINKWRLTRSSYTDLPFTTQYGRNWEAWMAFRELESNTRDENGETYTADGSIEGEAGSTRIVVDLEVFTEAWENRAEIFLPDAPRTGTGIQIVDAASNHLYWRGLRVYTTAKPTTVTYNFLDHMQLTEDRTLSYEFMARSALAAWLVKCDDEALIELLLTVDEDVWEHDLEFDSSIAPSAAFHRVMLRYPKNLNINVGAYYSRHDERIVERTFDVFDAHPLPWTLAGNTVFDAKDRAVFDAPYGYEGKWPLVGAAILRRVNPETPIVEEDVAEPIGEEQ